MGKVLGKGHAVPVPDEVISSKQGSRQLWYLPTLEYTIQKSQTKIRVVFDSSAECRDKSLNQELLTGPDLTQVLIVYASRKKMWFKNNDLSKPIAEFRMTVQLFENGPCQLCNGSLRPEENG